jgi:STE24 endopeptidase
MAAAADAATAHASPPYLGVALTFIVGVHVLHTYLDLRQLRALRMPQPPAALRGLFSKGLFDASRAYSLDKWWYGMAYSQFSLVEQCAQLWGGLLPWVWYRVTPALLPQQCAGAGSEVARSIVLMLVVSGLGLLSSLPWSYYKTCELVRGIADWSCLCGLLV